MRLVAAVAVALALVGVGLAATQPRIVELRWYGDLQGTPVFVPDGERVWVLSGEYSATNVFRMVPGSLLPKRLPIPRLSELYAGDGQLWGVQLVGSKPAERLSFVDAAHGYRLRPKRLPRAGCPSTHQDTLVFRGRLWFDCTYGRVLVYDPRRAEPVREFRKPGRLVESKRALWLQNVNGSLECVEGPCGRGEILVGPFDYWAEHGDTAWVVRAGSDPRQAFLAVVGFRARATSSDFTLKVPPGFTSPYELRVVGDELWLHSGGRRFAVARYSVNAPESPPRLLRLPGVRSGTEAAWPVEVGGGYAWISAGVRESVKAFRVPLSRDPPGLRQVRAALLVATERTPARFEVPSRAGAPIHASCDARGTYLGARAYYCTVRFAAGPEYMCVAVRRGRVVVDRRRPGSWACE
jgi:hypothetical protein